MNPLYDFIVLIPKLFNDEIVVGGLTLKKDMRWDDFDGRVPYGEVVHTPQKHKTVANVGDTLVFHHHISQQPDKFGIGDNKYLVSYHETDYQGQAYAAITPSGEVKMIGDWIFLTADNEEYKEATTESGIFLQKKEGHDKREAKVYCEGLGTDLLGIHVGDTVGYSKNSDYRIRLPNGDEVYRCKPNDLLYVNS